MSILKINDLQSAQTEGQISELSETELNVMGGHCGCNDGGIYILNGSLNGNNILNESQSQVGIGQVQIDDSSFAGSVFGEVINKYNN